MSYNWCHGPSCHTYSTQDRVRGSKGFKVLRTRKIKQHAERSWYDVNNSFNYLQEAESTLSVGNLENNASLSYALYIHYSVRAELENSDKFKMLMTLY